jgi:hypothetical protein
VCATSAFLSQVQLYVVVDNAVWAGVGYLFVAFGRLGVNNHQTVWSAINSIGGRRYAGCVLTVLAGYRHTVQLHARAFGRLAFTHLNPKLAGALRRRYWEPAVIAVLVFTGILTVATLNATAGVY